MSQIEPFKIAIPDEAITDLHRRLDAVRWPDKEVVPDWSQGVPLAQMRALAAYWRNEYDWRRCEAALNALGQYKTTIDGLSIHFLHIRSPNPNALPLIMTHGWPGSVIEFLKVIGPLSDPAAHGGDPADAFHLVIPSMPGYAFSEAPKSTGWGVERTAELWAKLMDRLGYTRFVAQGGDWGSVVTTMMGVQRPKGLAAIHVNMPIVLPLPPFENLSPEEADMIAAIEHYNRWDSGYSTEQASRPQTIGYSLADSPIGQAAWIYEKFWKWSDCNGDPTNALTRDEMLDNIMLYWLTNTGASSARLYWESYHGVFFAKQLDLPVGCSIFAKEIYRAPRSWADKCMSNIIHWNELDKGGHFAAFEQPALFVDEVRTCFRKIR